jgi:hypothetical protein
VWLQPSSGLKEVWIFNNLFFCLETIECNRNTEVSILNNLFFVLYMKYYNRATTVNGNS